MRKIYFLIIALVCFTGYIFAQNSIGGIPPSFNQLTENRISFDIRDIPQPDMAKIAQEDDVDVKSGNFYRIGRSVPVNLDMNTAGTWTNLPEGGKIWRLKLSCNGAEGISVYYNNFYIPRNGKLFIYNESKTQILGAYTSENNTDNGIFANEIVEGQTVTLEYYQSSVRSIEKPIISISEIGYIYRGTHFLFKELRAFGDAATCHPNINCSPEGDNWQDEKKGVARIFLTAAGSQGWCSGSVINNTALDCKKYFLTADHCGEGATTTELNQWVFYFNYEASGCTTPVSSPSYKSMVGCTLKANGGSGGSTGSDFFLVELKTASWPTGFVPYYNGWNRNTSATAGGVSIHHPMGDIKKISTFNGTPVSSTWGSAAGSHWRISWTSTTNGTGVTEGGSSGSPLFDSNGRIIGDLTGGGSYCTATTQPDYYGKFSYSWQSNGTTSATQLKPWLDPSNSGVMTLDGIYSPCSPQNNPPVADFTANTTSIVAGGSVTFTDLSTNTPTSWLWTLTGGTPSTSSSQNPTIVYSTAGTYNVSLKATNAYGNNTATKTAYITVLPQGSATCDTLTNFSGTPAVYGIQSPESGYMTGNNSYGDKSKAEYFASYAPYTKIDKFLVYFGVASGGSSNVTFNILNQSGSAPGSVIATATVSLTTIKTNTTGNLPTEIDFVPDVTIPGPFYFEVVLPTTAGDTVAIISNTDGDATANTSWEKWSDNTWHDFTSAWGVDLNLAISVIACTDGAAGTAPVANFSGTPTSVSEGGTVAFTDLSTNIPTSWSWAFAGGTPATSSLQSPSIVYSTAGTYNVSLTATNAYGNNLMTKTAYITVTQATTPTTCDTITNFAGTPAIYGIQSPESGYMTGNNSYGDKSKAEYFASYAPYTKIDQFLVFFGAATGTTGNVTFNLVNQSGNAPGTVFGTTTVPLSTIVTNTTGSLPTAVDFNPDVTIPGPFYFEVVLPTSAGDTVAIISNTDGDATANTSWEKWSDNTWHDFTSAWGVDLNLAIYAVLCPNSVDVVNAINENSITVYPNPTTGDIYINMNNVNSGKVSIHVYDVLGNLVILNDNQVFENNSTSLNMSNLSSGLYFMNINIDGKTLTKRISLQK
ncbi:MAG: hypothetical protein A2033_12715 [Bacteroidetes bacterium GWA2_31_9]|nr:MAG: hypothetical protein A2033_12715 [Bacteroidetes bacterium GWA2_31_9]